MIVYPDLKKNNFLFFKIHNFFFCFCTILEAVFDRTIHSQMFFKIRVHKNFCNYHRKTPLLMFLLDKIADL